MTDMSPDPSLASDRSVAAELRHAREAQGLALADVANRTRIPLRHLSAIETSQYDSLPAATYSAGFVKTYARTLGLDGDGLSRRFREEISGRNAAVERYEPYEPADPARTPSRLLAWTALGVAFLIGLAYLYWRGSQAGDAPAAIATQAQTAPQTTSAPIAAQPAARVDANATGASPAPAVPEAGGPVLLTAEQAAWIRVTDGDTKLFENVLKPGDHFEVPATAADPRLRTSRATALKVTVGGTAIPPLGPPETLIKNVSLLPKALLEAKPGAAAAPAAAATPTP